MNNEIEHQEPRELDNRVVADTEDQQDILEVKDDWLKNLWDQVHNAKNGSKTFDLALFDELDIKKPPLHFDLTLLYGDMGSQHSQQSLDTELKELPHYRGEQENKSEVMVIPSV